MPSLIAHSQEIDCSGAADGEVEGDCGGDEQCGLCAESQPGGGDVAVFG